MSLYARLAAALVLVLLVAAAVWKHASMVEAVREEGRAEVREQARQAADAQAARNRELQRAAELRYTVAAQTRERFFVTTVKEISDAAAPLAACPVPEPLRVRLNDAAACARGDSPAACGAAVQVPGP